MIVLQVQLFSGQQENLIHQIISNIISQKQLFLEIEIFFILREKTKPDQDYAGSTALPL